MQYGVLCLLPPAAMLIFALKTKKSFEALIFGTLVAYLIMYKAAFIGPWCDLLLSEISNADNQYILLLCGLFGGFIFLLREAKGTLGFSNLLSRFCKNERITMMMSVFLGIIIFVDDYLNIMTVGTCMKDVCDKRKVPRQALAYIIDSTGAPVCALIPFSTWVVFYSGIGIFGRVINAHSGHGNVNGRGIVHFWMLRCLLFLFQIGIGIFHFSELWHQFAGKQNDNQKCSHGIKHIRKHF